MHHSNLGKFEKLFQIDALEAEVSALKSIVLTSTPSNPNPESHPQLVKKKDEKLSFSMLF